MKKPLILISNDDGIYAGGIKALIEVAKTIGEVVVVAPEGAQSAKSSAITINDPLRIYPVDSFEGVEAYKVNGTPVDCVKLAKFVVLKDRKIDICVTGINHGSNASINIIYSGTMGAAIEASIEGIPAIGFSLLDYSPDANFENGKPFIKRIIESALVKGMGSCNLLNVNIPNLPTDEIKGIKVCRQADAKWKESFATKEDPFGRPYYWLTGEFINLDKKKDNDVSMLTDGYVSVVPCTFDLTNYNSIDPLKEIFN